MIEHGDCRERMAALPEAIVDAIVTDPPYGLEFMGKAWDSFTAAPANPSGPQTEAWHDSGGRTPYARRATPRYAGKQLGSKLAQMHAFQAWCEEWAGEALRVLKPGAHVCAFGGTRTSHRMTSALEDAGFEVRDSLVWLYGSGFPKSRNLDGAWTGWGSALKPAHEPIVLARKPLDGTLEHNVVEHGPGALNIADCRVEFRDQADEEEAKEKNRHADFGSGPRDNHVYGADERPRGESGNYDAPGRWPPNVALDETAAAMLDAQLDGGASRFFYCPKASRGERDAGLDEFEKKPILWSSGEQNPGSFQAEGTDRSARNPHPTVKPIELMRWLCRLVTPIGGVVLDPFCGSGTTGIAAALEGFRFHGIDLDAEYLRIAQARIDWWQRNPAGPRQPRRRAPAVEQGSLL